QKSAPRLNRPTTSRTTHFFIYSKRSEIARFSAWSTLMSLHLDMPPLLLKNSRFWIRRKNRQPRKAEISISRRATMRALAVHKQVAVKQQIAVARRMSQERSMPPNRNRGFYLNRFYPLAQTPSSLPILAWVGVTSS